MYVIVTSNQFKLGDYWFIARWMVDCTGDRVKMFTNFVFKPTGNVFLEAVIDSDCIFTISSQFENRENVRDTLQKMMKFPHIFCWGNFGETDSFPVISQRGNGTVRFP